MESDGPAKLPRGSLLDVLALGPTSLVYTRDKSEAQNAVKKRLAVTRSMKWKAIYNPVRDLHFLRWLLDAHGPHIFRANAKMYIGPPFLRHSITGPFQRWLS